LKKDISDVIKSAISYNKGDARRINHLLKVYSFAKAIGELEFLDEKTQEILEVSAVLHDIGIHECEKKYSSTSGNYQQIEGPSIAQAILNELNYKKETIERVCFLIAHHHTYNNIVGEDYQILVEADFLVNIYEEEMKTKEIESIEKKIFKTKTGKEFLHNLFGK